MTVIIENIGQEADLLGKMVLLRLNIISSMGPHNFKVFGVAVWVFTKLFPIFVWYIQM